MPFVCIPGYVSRQNPSGSLSFNQDVAVDDVNLTLVAEPTHGACDRNAGSSSHGGNLLMGEVGDE